MAENSKIQWTHHTFNPWRGCSKVAPGCANCYADAQSKRNPKTLGIWGPDGTRVVASEAMWREPLKWNKAAENVAIEASQHNHRFARDLDVEILEPRSTRVFCASLADVFEDWPGEVQDHQGCAHFTKDGDPTSVVTNDQMRGTDSGGYHYTTLDDCRGRLFRLIDATPNLDWLLLTKRPANIRQMVYDAWTEKVVGYVSQNEGDGRRWKRRDNVWLGTSIACQEDADRNVPELLKCRDLAPVLFLSLEPLIGPVDIVPFIGGRSYQCKCGFHHTENELLFRGGDEYQCQKCFQMCRIGPTVDWVIVGGESGPNARPCRVDWVRSIVRQCRDAKVPCFVKQLGAMIVDRNDAGFDAEWNDNKGWPSSVGVVHNPNGYLEEYQGAPVEVRTNDKKGGDPDEWPADLRVRQFPGEAI